MAVSEVPRELQMDPCVVERESGERRGPLDVREVQRRTDGGGCDQASQSNEAGNLADSVTVSRINAARSWPSAVSATSNSRITRHPG